MNEKIFVFLIGLSLGWILKIFHGEFTYNADGMITALGTTGMFIVSAYALNNWRKQLVSARRTDTLNFVVKKLYHFRNLSVDTGFDVQQFHNSGKEKKIKVAKSLNKFAFELDELRRIVLLTEGIISGKDLSKMENLWDSIDEKQQLFLKAIGEHFTNKEENNIDEMLEPFLESVFLLEKFISQKKNNSR